MSRATFLIIFLSLTGLSHTSFGAVNLSVNPVDGSNSLRFERTPNSGAEINQEIHIRINSTNGGQFQVFQRILEPIVNEKGEALNLQAINTQTLANSNSSGALYLQNSGYMSMSDQLLYSSSQSGASDSFIVGYSLNHNLINASGTFRGRLIFTVRSGASSDQQTIDVFLQTSPSLNISIKGAHDPKRIHVHGTDTSDKSGDFVNISFTGNLGQEIRIYQEIETVPQNESEDELGADVLQLDVQGDSEGLRKQGLGSLGNGKTLIYSSNKDEDNFVVHFLVNPGQVQQQDAGIYSGRIKYVVETDQGSQEFPIDVSIEIPPIFILNVTTPPGGVGFIHVLANNPPQFKDVQVTVLTNLHKPYQVLQDVVANMTNQQGKEFSSQYFNIQVEIPLGVKGQSSFMEFSPVQTGDNPVFSSDAQGSSATFTIVYRLQGYDQLSPGNYSAPVRLSLNQK